MLNGARLANRRDPPGAEGRLRMASRWLIAYLAIVLSSGCAVQRPPGRPVTAHEQRLSFRGFSILPPQGRDWYIRNQTPSDIVFFKPLTDKTKPSSQAHSTFGIVVMVVYPDEGSVGDLREYVRQRLRGEGRFTNVQSRVASDNALDVECVRFESVSEERDNPLVPGVLTLTGYGVFCRHPFSPRYLFHLSYSERYPQKEPSRLDDVVRAEAEAVLKSVVFAPFPKAELPPDARVVPPAPNVPSAQAAYSGKWTGTFDGNGVDHLLLVEEVHANDAVVVISLGLLNRTQWQRRKASFRQGALVLSELLSYRLQPDGTLLATITDGGATSHARMTRITE
jgi:hypothetical protein